MKQFVKSFEIRWSDLDANRHVANSTYVDLLSQTRLSYLDECGFTQRKFSELDIGPVMFSEEFFYIKEVMPSETVSATIELLANSPNCKYVKFAHCIYNQSGVLSVYSEMFFGWMDLKLRKLIVPPSELAVAMHGLPKSDNYVELPERVNLKNDKIPFGQKL